MSSAVQPPVQPIGVASSVSVGSPLSHLAKTATSPQAMLVLSVVLALGAIILVILAATGVLFPKHKTPGPPNPPNPPNPNPPNAKPSSWAWKAEHAPGRVHELDESSALALMAAPNTGAAVVMVYAPWCGACKRARPGVDATSASDEARRLNVRFVAVNGDSARAFSQAHSVRAFPTFFGKRADGKVVPFPPRTMWDQAHLLTWAQSLVNNTA